MIEPKDKFAKILSDLEKEIRDPHDLKIAKKKLLEVSMMFIDITNRAMDNSNQYESLSKKIDKMQKSLKRIEAPSSEIGPSLEVLCGAIELYEKDPNFYWVDWEENQKLLKDEKEEN